MDTEERSRWLSSLKQNAGRSESCWWTTCILSICLGCFGADRFYAGSPMLGLAKLCTAGGAGVWWLLDVILLFNNKMRDDHGAVIRRPF